VNSGYLERNNLVFFTLKLAKMKTVKKSFIFLSLALLVLSTAINGQDYKFLKGPVTGISETSGIDNPVTVKVIYDNYLKNKELKEDWGFSIMVEGLDRELIFDTGTSPDIFASNFRKMGLDASKVDLLVISHEHGDHTGGIPAFAEMKTGIPIIIPYSFSTSFKKRMTGLGLEPVLVREPAQICEHLYTSGVFDYQIAEQSLVLDTKKGLVVMTGCSHPGIIDMLKEIKSTFNKNVYMVFGGFHLMQKSDKEMDTIISEMKDIGVVKCGATHCTGDRQIQMIREAYGDGYFELGVGNTIVIN
jgi:7,8-dihydropterin-6-yl-methyl-4-(beta-D-ribofuranosyl)aminobenzene 5'-phosphate synthase